VQGGPVDGDRFDIKRAKQPVSAFTPGFWAFRGHHRQLPAPRTGCNSSRARLLFGATRPDSAFCLASFITRDWSRDHSALGKTQSVVALESGRLRSNHTGEYELQSVLSIAFPWSTAAFSGPSERDIVLVLYRFSLVTGNTNLLRNGPCKELYPIVWVICIH
jgi:hypothetical protein